jgi:hypothetical protein
MTGSAAIVTGGAVKNDVWPAANPTLTVGEIIRLTVVGGAKATLTFGAAKLFTAIVVEGANAMLTGDARILSGGVAIATVAESKRDGSLLSVAATVRVGGEGTVTGAVYWPVEEIVPTVSLPLATPLTLQVTEGVLVPLMSAVNCWVCVGNSTALVGVMVTKPRTVNGSGDVAEPSGVVTVIGPVSAPGGTDVVRLFIAAAVTVAIAPLKETPFWVGSGLKPRPKIDTAVPTLPLLGATSVMATGPGMSATLWRPMARIFPTAS